MQAYLQSVKGRWLRRAGCTTECTRKQAEQSSLY